MGVNDLADESQDGLENDDAVEESGEESEREEDPGGGSFQYDDGTSNDPSSMDTSQTGLIDSMTEAGPSGSQVPQPAPQQPPSQPPVPQPQVTPLPLPISIDSPR